MLKGIDISHHNKWQYDHGMLDFDKQDFVILKASEGRTYNDPMMDSYLQDLKDKPIGFYHYARPENNSAIVEAEHFCQTINSDMDRAMLVLDWEGNAIRYPISWALDWLNRVEQLSGKKPVIYCSSWYTKQLKPVLENNNGLWVAHYTKANKPTVFTYPFWMMWQYTSNPYDKDIFNGSLEQWYKYC